MDEQSILSDGKTRNFLGEVLNANISSSSSSQQHPTTSAKLKGVMSEPNGQDQFPVLESSQSQSPWSAFGAGMKVTHLFQKKLTKSDVGNLNRMVIPNRYALKHFPAISEENKNDKDASFGILLNFYDLRMKLWPFWYCYRTTIESYVFTMGWYEFARENRLRAGDRVIISCGECNNQKIYIIEVAYYDGTIMNGSGNIETGMRQSQDDDSEVVEVFPVPVLEPVLEPELKPVPEPVVEPEPVLEPPVPVAVAVPTEEKAKRGFKLFGVWIDA